MRAWRGVSTACRTGRFPVRLRGNGRLTSFDSAGAVGSRGRPVRKVGDLVAWGSGTDLDAESAGKATTQSDTDG